MPDFTWKNIPKREKYTQNGKNREKYTKTTKIYEKRENISKREKYTKFLLNGSDQSIYQMFKENTK
jgi:hypothetical protein